MGSKKAALQGGLQKRNRRRKDMTPSTRSTKVVKDNEEDSMKVVKKDNEEDIDFEARTFDGVDEDTWQPWMMKFRALACSKKCEGIV
jgi:hypothetical protein